MIRAIIAEDHPTLRNAIRALVESYPALIVGEAENGLEATRAVEREQPDLAILDVSMPVMNGLVAARCIGTLDPQLPIIMVTEHTEFTYVEEAFRCGARGYVAKARAATHLHAAIQAVLAGRVYKSI